MQKAFVFILFMWNSSTSTSHNVRYLRPFSLGCEAVIPCQNDTVYLGPIKWLYRRRGEVKTILTIEKGGLPKYDDAFRHQIRLGDKGSLIISPFTEDYEGLYRCETQYCDQSNCRTSRTIRVKKDIVSETFQTVQVSAGGTFTFECPGEYPNTRWTFEARNKSPFMNQQEPEVVTSNKSIHIVNIKTEDAGNYTCSVSKCNGYFVKRLTLTLCVTDQQCRNLSDSCPVCDLRFNNTERHNVTHEHSCGSLNCSSDQNMNLTSHTSNNTSAPCQRKMTVTFATLGAFVCLIFMTLISCYFRLKLRAACRRCPSCFDIDGTVEEEASMVYSSIIIRKPAPMRNNHIPTSAQEDCVYSELKAFT